MEIKCSDTESAVLVAPCHRLRRGLCSHLHRRLSKREGGIRPEGLYSVFPARVGAYRIPLLLNRAEITALPCATLRPCPQDQQKKGMRRKRGGKRELSICLCHVSSHKLLLLLSLVSQPENGKCPFAQSHPELIRGWAVATHLGPQRLSCAPQGQPRALFGHQ